MGGGERSAAAAGAEIGVAQVPNGVKGGTVYTVARPR
jgi:hypothetical protein